MNVLCSILLRRVLVMATLALIPFFACLAAADSHWVASWQASPQKIWGDDFLFPTRVPTLLHEASIRQVVRLSVGGERARLVLSNTYGTEPLVIGAASVALPDAEEGSVRADTLQPLTFGGETRVVIAPGASIVSDAVTLATADLEQFVVTLYLPEPTRVSTFHWDGRQTGWIVAGKQTEAARLDLNESSSLRATARLIVTGVHVARANPARAVVVLGDSITDGATATVDRDARWPDFLAARLAPHGIAVLNAGISGARLLSDGMGVNALARFERDVLAQPGVRVLFVLLGINDIAWPGTAFAPSSPSPSLAELTAGYRQLIARAHTHAIRVVGATLTPFEGALPGTPLTDYYHPDKEGLRQEVNAWIRTSSAFDAVVDFDAALRDPIHPMRLAAPFDSGDHLHPGDEGNRALADAIDLRSLLADFSESKE